MQLGTACKRHRGRNTISSQVCQPSIDLHAMSPGIETWCCIYILMNCVVLDINKLRFSLGIKLHIASLSGHVRVVQSLTKYPEIDKGGCEWMRFIPK